MSIFFRSIVIGACAAAMLAFPAAVSAQRTGSRVGTDLTEKNLMGALEIMADCVASRRPELARKWLGMLPGTAEEADLVRSETEDLGQVCMDSDRLVMDGKALVIKPAMIRRPMAVAMARALLRKAPAQVALSTGSNPWFMPILAQLPSGAAVDRPALGLQDFGHCVAVNQWPGTRAFLLSKPESAGEKTALKMLVPALGPCLTDDAKISLTPANLRVILGEPVYHILSNPAAFAPAASAGR